MSRAVPSGLAAAFRRHGAAVGALAICLAAAASAVAPGGLAAVAARAAIAAAAVAAVALLVARGGAAPERAVATVVARVPLGKDSGVAVVDWGGRRVLVGFGRSGVCLLGDAPPQPAERSLP